MRRGGRCGSALGHDDREAQAVSRVNARRASPVTQRRRCRSLLRPSTGGFRLTRVPARARTSPEREPSLPTLKSCGNTDKLADDAKSSSASAGAISSGGEDRPFEELDSASPASNFCQSGFGVDVGPVTGGWREMKSALSSRGDRRHTHACRVSALPLDPSRSRTGRRPCSRHSRRSAPFGGYADYGLCGGQTTTFSGVGGKMNAIQPKLGIVQPRVHLLRAHARRPSTGSWAT